MIKNLSFLLALSLFLAYTPVQVHGEELSSDRPVYWVHIVEEGDNLHFLAARYYNNARLWKRIYRTNKEIIKNPNILHPGQKLLIPKDEEDESIFLPIP